MLEVRGIPDLFAEGVKGGWFVRHLGQATRSEVVECDVLIIGTGAGGGTAAEVLAQAGLDVVLLEEGPLRTSNDFHMKEKEAYRDLYQEGAGRATKDGRFIVLQGRSVGGSTTVNWTSSFRTPEPTLQWWAREHGVKGLGVAELAPWFQRMEERLGIAPWAMEPNANNDVLRRGCEKLGWAWHAIPRNVKGCWNLGYCGLGCPTNAKQSMLVTTIPEALKQRARLYYRARAERLVIEGDQVHGAIATGMQDDGVTPAEHGLVIKARHTVVACGGINGPGLLLRSRAPDPHRRLGKRTFLHPVPACMARYDAKIEPFYGAPQSIYSDHFQWRDGVTGHMGYKLEAIPMQPGLTAAIIGRHGLDHAADMQALPHTQGMIALLRDGFHPDSIGGRVELRDDNSPVLDYPLNDYVFDGVRRAWLSMAEIQFAAGARAVRPLHLDAPWVKSWAEAKAMIADLGFADYRLRLGSAHVMGGCAMGDEPQQAVVNSRGRHHQLDGLSVMDGSLFPTSIGANPQLSIFGVVAKLASGLAQELKRA